MAQTIAATVVGLFALFWCLPVALAQVSASLVLPDGEMVAEENGTIQVCVELSRPITSPVTLKIATDSVSAEDQTDYESIDTVLTFSSSTIRRCIHIEIKQDNIVEGDEFFRVELSIVTGNDIMLGRNANIRITDSSKLLIGFQESDYTVTEDSTTVIVCAVVVNGSIDGSDRTVEVNVRAAGGTATSGDDYDEILLELDFTMQVETACGSIRLVDDKIIEDTEEFTITLTNSVEAEFVNGTATVTILDDDGATISLQTTNLIITEGNETTTETVNFCIVLENILDGLDREVEVNLTTNTDTADMQDFQSLSGQMIIIPNTTTEGEAVCTNITILGDDLMEGNESFTITVVVSGPDSISGPNTTTITIVDDGDFDVCRSLSDPLNGQVVMGEAINESTANYTCNEGYVLNGTETRVCQASGEWEPEEPSCYVVDCGALEIMNGDVDSANTTFGSVATYSCSTGYRIEGTNTRICQTNGSWTGKDPSCEVIDCGRLEPPANSEITISTTFFGSVVTYTCNDGFEQFNGTTQRTCQDSGQWSGRKPTCVSSSAGSVNQFTGTIIALLSASAILLVLLLS